MNALGITQTSALIADPSKVSSLSLWLKADANAYKDAGTTLAANGETVQQWNSQVGGINASQATSGKRPTYVTNVQNSLPILRFVAANSTCLQVASLALSGPLSLFFVGQFNTAAAQPFFEHGANANSNDGFFFNGTSVSMWQVRKSGAVSNGAGIANWGTGSAAFNVFSLIYYGTAANTEELAQVRLNKVIQANGTRVKGATLTGSTTTAFNICSRNQASIFSTGDLGELLLYDRALNDVQFNQVHYYLKTRWGL